MESNSDVEGRCGGVGRAVMIEEWSKRLPSGMRVAENAAAEPACMQSPGLAGWEGDLGFLERTFPVLRCLPEISAHPTLLAGLPRGTFPVHVHGVLLLFLWLGLQTPCRACSLSRPVATSCGHVFGLTATLLARCRACPG